MQTGDIMMQWMLENYGKFNRGVGESQNPVFILFIIIILIVTSATFQSFQKVIGLYYSGMFWWHLCN